LKVTANFDVYNLFDANTPLAVNTRYGPSFLTPTTVLFGRLAKVGVQLDF
jgi:outer membrane receptor protein involved in Fe transport